jgi:hypothetical protein
VTHEPEVIERRLKEAFAHVDAPAGVDAWRNRPLRSHCPRSRGRSLLYGIRSRLSEMALTVGITAALLVVSVAGTMALSHSHSAPVKSAPPSVAPATTGTPSPGPTATTSLCSRLETPTSIYGITFAQPGGATPTIACSQAIATLRCPPQLIAGSACITTVGPITAALVGLSTVRQVAEVRANGFRYAGPPFRARNLLVWRLTFVPTVCTVDSTGVSSSDAPPLSVFSTNVSTRCRSAQTYLIDASTGYFVFYFDPPSKSTSG